MSHFVTALKGVTLNCPVLTKILRPKLPKSVASRGTGDGKQGDRRREIGKGKRERLETGDGKRETGNGRWETGDGKRVMGDG